MPPHPPSNGVETLDDSPERSLSEKEKADDPRPDAAATNEDDDFPHGLKLVLLVVALCLSVFLVALDNTIIATAIPKITDHFQSLDDVGWYGSAYFLATAATQLAFGKCYTVLPIKWVYITAIVFFEVGSALCGAAPNSDALIVGRAIAGMGSAGIFSGALIIIAHSVPMVKRPIFAGIIGAMYGIASVIGPLLGGAFTDKITWRWCFYINLPIGAVTLLFMIFRFQMPQSAELKPTTLTLMERINLFDPFGTLVFIPSIISLLLALQWGGSRYAWNNGRIIGLFVVFAVLLAMFIGIQFWKQDNATVPPRILKQRSIWATWIYALCMGGSYFIVIFYLPIWFQAIKGTSAVQSGINNLPMILSVVFATLLAGGAISAMGYYTQFLILSGAFMAIGAGLLSTLKVNSKTAPWVGYQIIYGLGVGFGMQQAIISAQTGLPLSDVPIGTALIMFAQTLGCALFVSVGQNVFQNKLLSGLVSSVPGINPDSVLQIGATSLQHTIDPKFLPDVLFVYNKAIASAFYVAIALAGVALLGSLFVEWKSVKGSNSGATDGDKPEST
ncbi:putative MFS multidrug transporter [Mycena rebaudengoi]|nr:putative MFS multidrug transporter [Mycena rebaudengoi]